MLAALCKERQALSPKAESVPWNVYQISTGFFCSTAFVPRPGQKNTHFAVAMIGNHVLAVAPTWSLHSLRWSGFYWILVLKNNTDSKAIKTFSAPAHKELEITVLKNRIFLPPPQRLPHPQSLTPKPISERLQPCCIKFSPNSSVFLFLGKDTLTVKTVDMDLFREHWASLCVWVSDRTEVLIWKKQRSRTLLFSFPLLPIPGKCINSLLETEEAEMWGNKP